MVFIACFVLTSIQYEWKSIFHLDQIVSLLRQHRRCSPERRRSSSAGPPLPPHSCILCLITCVRGPRRQVYEALGNSPCWWCLSDRELVVLTDAIWWRRSDPDCGCRRWRNAPSNLLTRRVRAAKSTRLVSLVTRLNHNTSRIT